MILFFSVFGFIFIAFFAIITEYLYDIFPINRITNFFKPISAGTWNKVNSTVLPIILWGFIELPILINNSHFLLALVLNILVSCSVLYVIRFSSLLFKKENKVIDIISILVATGLGQFISYLSLFTGNNVSNVFSTIFGVISIFLIYTLITLFPPRSSFFRGE